MPKSKSSSSLTREVESFVEDQKKNINFKLFYNNRFNLYTITNNCEIYLITFKIFSEKIKSVYFDKSINNISLIIH